MKLVTFATQPTHQTGRFGVLIDDTVIDVAALLGDPIVSSNFSTADFLERSTKDRLARLLNLCRISLADNRFSGYLFHPLKKVSLAAPIPQPLSIRDFIAFEGHIQTMRAKRSAVVPDAWYKIPIHYRGNHLGVLGPDCNVPWPSYTEKFDFELELACVIGKKGRNISVQDAPNYIAGYMIMNDWSCRDIQRDEMAGGLGPAMAKPGPSFGPYLLTADEVPELAQLHHEPSQGPLMRAFVNGELWSEGRFGALYWSFAQMIAHISQDTWIYPGEVLGSGTVGGGCGAELDRWLQIGDVVQLEVEGFGKLINVVGQKGEK